MSHLSDFRAALSSQGFQAAFLTSGESVSYLSGFTGYGDAWAFVTDTNAFLITDSRYSLQAERECPGWSLRICGGDRQFLLASLLQEEGVSQVAFEWDRLSYREFHKLRAWMGLEEGQCAAVDEVLTTLRRRKDAAELDLIRKSCQIACWAYEELLPKLCPGISEQDVAAELEFLLRKGGASKTSFDTIVASGWRGAMPHGTASEKLLEAGDGITLDFGCVFHGYCSDMTRTVFLGEPSDEMRRIYEVVLAAQEQAIAGYEPGMCGADLDALARRLIAEAGYGDSFGHSLGHGVGLEVHEGPTVSPRSTMLLEDGMVFSIEPGIYVPGVGGVRIEDLVLLQDGRLEILTPVSKALRILR